jgi:hypothetical protein
MYGVMLIMTWKYHTQRVRFKVLMDVTEDYRLVAFGDVLFGIYLPTLFSP